MLEKITAAFAAHAATYEGAAALWDKTRKELEANYKGHLLRDKMLEGKQLFQQTIDDSRNNNLAVCVSVLDEARQKVTATAAKPVDPAFSAALDALKTIKSPTAMEFDLIVGQFQDNYFSYRAVSEALGGAEKGYPTITVDTVMGFCNSLEQVCRDCLNATPGSYTYRNIMSGGSLTSPDKILTDFIGGKFSAAQSALQDLKQNRGNNGLLEGDEE